MNNDETLIIVRPASEISIKKRNTQQRFMKQLRQNLQNSARRLDIPQKMQAIYNRIFIRTTNPEAMLDLVSHVSGIGSYSRIEATCPAEFDQIIETGTQTFQKSVTGKSFAIDTRSMGRYPFRNSSINIDLGARLNAFAEKVDLTTPDITIYVEIVGDKAHLTTQRIKALDGLPMNTQGKALALISGGFDSPVAAWRMMRRGINTDFIFFNLGGSAHERHVIKITKQLCDRWAHGHSPRLYVVDFNHIAEAIQQNTKQSYWQVLLKRMMYKAAEKIAEKNNSYALITGEAIGQVSSQTLKNLSVIDSSINLPVFRPLIGFDKQDIIAQARLIGTEKLSANVQEFCNITTGRPSIASEAERVLSEENKLDLSILDQCLAGTKIIDPKKLTQDDLESPSFFVDEIGTDAVIIDCQAKHMFKKWRIEGAKNIAPETLIDEFKSFDQKQKYILYCAHGSQTPYLAEQLQELGFEAFAFRGGLSALKKKVQSAA